MPTIRDLMALINELAPWRLAEEWDNCGLMMGTSGAPADTVALALDPTPSAVQKAKDIGARVLLTHHPLFFKGLKKIDLDDLNSSTAALALKLDISIVSAHTNLDASITGVGRALAEKLELADIEPLEPAASVSHYKLAAYVPYGYEGFVRESILGALPAKKGMEEGRCFYTRGQGVYFQQKQNPADLHDSYAEEGVGQSRLEVLIERGNLEAVFKALAMIQPQVRVPYDVYPLAPSESQEGFGCVGLLKKPLNIKELAGFVKEKLNVSGLRIAAPPQGGIQKIALMPGSGGSYMIKAKARGAEALISGDISYHLGHEAEHLGICLIDAGHWPTERPVLEFFATALEKAASKRSMNISFIIIKDERDPWVYMEG